MKKYIILLFLLFVSISFYAQDGESDISLDVKMTEVFKDKKKFTNLAFTTKDGNDGVFIGRRYKKGYYIEHYDKDINLVKNYDFEISKTYGQIEEAFISQGNLCLIEYLYNKKSKKLEYYVNTSPSDKFSFTRKLLFSVPLKDVKKRSSIVFVVGVGTSGFDDDLLGKVEVSKDQEYIAFTVDIRDKSSETHRLFVFDNALNEVYRTEFKRGLKDKKFILQNIDIDESDGTVYLLGKTYPREKKKKKDGGKYQFELYKIKGDSKQSLIFDSSTNYIGSLTTVINKGKLFCVGFYSEKNDYRYKGVVYFNISPQDMKLNTSNFLPFTKQFILDKYGKDKQKELKNISFRDILITDKNECIINAEEYYITSRYVSNSNGGGYWKYTYNFRDIISVKIGSDGKLLWARNINKRQAASFYSPYLSYTSTYYNGKVYFFINCSDKVKKLRNDRLQFSGTSAKRSNFYVITINEKGDFGYKKILDDKDSEVPFAVGDGFLNKNGTDIIFQGRKGSKKQIMKVSL